MCENRSPCRRFSGLSAKHVTVDPALMSLDKLFAFENPTENEQNLSTRQVLFSFCKTKEPEWSLTHQNPFISLQTGWPHLTRACMASKCGIFSNWLPCAHYLTSKSAGLEHRIQYKAILCVYTLHLPHSFSIAAFMFRTKFLASLHNASTCVRWLKYNPPMRPQQSINWQDKFRATGK